LAAILSLFNRDSDGL